MPSTTVCLTYIIGMLNKYFEINLIPALPVIELWQGRKSKPGYEKQPIGKDFKYHMEDVNFTVYMQNLN